MIFSYSHSQIALSNRILLIIFSLYSHCILILSSFYFHYILILFTLYSHHILMIKSRCSHSILISNAYILQSPHYCKATLSKLRTLLNSPYTVTITRESRKSLLVTGWRRLIGSPNLQIIFNKRATKYRSLFRKITYKDKGSYESSPPSTLIVLALFA